MKKKLTLLIALCMLSIFALTACADDVTEDGDDVTIGASPTTSTAPGNGSNGNEDDNALTGIPDINGGTGTNGDSGTTGGANDSTENTNGAVTGETGQNGQGNGNANGVNGSLTVTPRP